MPKLKSAVNSFLLTKKRLKKRKTNKRKGKTNRRYKRWMRGGAFAAKDKNEQSLIEVIQKLNEDPLPTEAELNDISNFLENFSDDSIKTLKKEFEYGLDDLITKLKGLTTKPNHVEDIIRNLEGISVELKKNDDVIPPLPLGAKAVPNAASEPQGPATKLIIQHGEPPNVKETIYILEKPILGGGSLKGGRRRR